MRAIALAQREQLARTLTSAPLLRQFEHMSEAGIAEACGVTISTVQRWRNGGRVSAPVARSICARHGWTIGQVWFEEEQP